jgi:hypothetical protein
MAIRISKVVANYESPFYRFILRNVQFSQLAFHGAKQGHETTKKQFSTIIPEYSVTVQRANSQYPKFRGLPLYISMFSKAVRHTEGFEVLPFWVLGYHSIRQIEALVLFPCSVLPDRRQDRMGQYLVSRRDLFPYQQSQKPDALAPLADLLRVESEGVKGLPHSGSLLDEGGLACARPAGTEELLHGTSSS